MRKKITVFILASLLVFSISACGNSSSSERATDFTETTLDGRTVSLSDYKGSVVVVNFWGTWCPYCVMEMEDIYAATQKYPDVVFLMVNTSQSLGHESTEAIQSYFDLAGFSFDNILLNQKTAQSYGIRSFPTTYVIDADGNVYEKVTGTVEGTKLGTMIEKAAKQ